MSWTDLPHLIASLGGYAALAVIGVWLAIRWLRRALK